MLGSSTLCTIGDSNPIAAATGATEIDRSFADEFATRKGLAWPGKIVRVQ